jgi:hypothetical protein
MPINPNIALGVQPPQQSVNMLGQLGQLYALKAAKQDIEGNEALRDVYSRGGDMNDPEVQRQLRAANPKVASQLLSQYATQRKTEMDTLKDEITLRRDALANVRTPEEYLSWHEANHTGRLGAFFKSTGVNPSTESIMAELAKPGGLDRLKRESALGATRLQQELMQTERTYGAASISAAPGHARNALEREKWTYDINNPKLERYEGETGAWLYDSRRPNSAVPLGAAPQPGTPAIPPTAPANGLLITGAATPPSAALNLNALTGGAPNQTAPTVANAAAADAAARAAAQPTIIKPKGPTGTMAGYRKTADGNLEFIPGGPADPAVQARQATVKLSEKDLMAREAKFPQATSALKAFDAKTGKFERDINELIDNKKGLDEITGFLAGRTDLSAMSDAGRRALSLFNTITAKGGFSELQDMRNASPTGGALGNVSNQEGKQLIDSFGALSRTQSGEDLRKSLNTALSDLQNLRQRMKEAYDLTYEYKAGRAPSSSGGGAPSGGFTYVGKE